eukprot:15031469-Alexandrium_andersonii.AAC.1
MPITNGCARSLQMCPASGSPLSPAVPTMGQGPAASRAMTGQVPLPVVPLPAAPLPVMPLLSE